MQALADVGGGQCLELKHRAAGKQRVVYIKVWVLGGGGNQGDGALLYTFQQALLLALVEVLDLVQIQQNAAVGTQGADVVQHRLDVAGGGGGAVKFVQFHAAACSDDAGHSGFAYAGGTVEDHVGDMAAFDRAAENLILA